jgi:ribosomal protein S18 acetylase RimI-like enzyme
MIIRPMIRQDKAITMRILLNTPEFTPEEVDLAEEVIDAYLFNPATSGYYVLVGEIDSNVVGYVCYGPTPITDGTWDLYWIAVNRAIQGQGIGKQLMAAAENEIRKARGRLIIVETSSKPGYEKTNAFYQHIGYTETCRIKDYYMIGDDQVIYEKRFKVN